MANTPEGKVKAQVSALLDQYTIYYFFPATHGYGRSGVPDIVCCVRGAHIDGEFVAIECKAGTGKITALQDSEMEKIRAAGGTTFLINEETLGALELWLKTHALPRSSVPVVKKKSKQRL